MAERGLADQIAYWSPAGSRQTKVDFLLSRDSGDCEHCALEVKATRNVQPQHLAGLRAIAPLQGLRRRVLVYQGQGNRPGITEDGLRTVKDALTSLGIRLIAPTAEIAVNAARHRRLNISLADGFALATAQAHEASVASYDRRVRRTLPRVGLQLCPYLG